MLARTARCILAALVAVTISSSIRAQGGYTSEKHPDLGLTFQRARDYEQIPTPPDETYVVLHFAEKLPAKPAKEKDQAAHAPPRPEMAIVWIDNVADETAATGGGKAAPPGEPPDGEKPKEGDKPTPEAKAPAKPPINSLERWIDQRCANWKLGKPGDAKSHGAWTGREYPLYQKKSGGSKIQGWAWAWTSPTRTIAVVGWADESVFDHNVDIWRVTAEKMEIEEPEEQSTAKLEAHYAHLTLRDAPFRITVRKKLVHGWKAEDSENYIFVYDTPDQPLIRKVINDIELMRKEYEKLFPAEKPVTAVSTVRICKSHEEYASYGGPPRSAGYWNYETEELVLYDAEKVGKNYKTSDADTFIVLYHEAFHQYIYYSTGELPPHSWFNEGHGDYFSGARIRDGKMRSIGVNPWRIKTIQDAITLGKFIPFSEITKFEQPEYYRSDIVHICYAEGWSIIYFLRTAKEVAKKPEWAHILPTYFDTLKSAYAEELAKAGNPDEKTGAVKRMKAGLAARTRALEVAFKGVDMDQLESSWKAYITSLELPKEK